ncbi:MAG: FtsK/SpoIIIE domain-containing protein [Sulfuricurvum sp.]|nr:FtsK/SpoIIIE domain-containing protein [Sulfuricurvum sp.]
MIIGIVLKLLITFILFKYISINYTNEFLIHYLDSIFQLTVGGIILHHFIFFDYFKNKVYKLPRTFNYKNTVEKNIFTFNNLKYEVKKITYYDYVESYKDGRIIIKNKSGLIDLELYEKNKEQIKHYLNTDHIKIEKCEDNGIVIDTKDRLDLYNWNGEEFLKKGFIFFGLNHLGEKIFLDLFKMTHYFINGQSGSGKSLFITQILNGLIYNLDLVKNIFLVDFKGGLTFEKYGKIDKKIIVGYKVEHLIKIVDYVYKENQRRMEYLKNKGLEKYEKDPIFLIFDEWSEVVESCPLKELDKDGYLQFKQMLLKIESIGQLGRSQGVRLLIQTQRGGTEIISSKLRGNLQSRILLRVDNNDGVKMCLGSLDYLEKIGNVSPTSFGPGRFVFLDNSSTSGLLVQYGQSSFITPNEYINTCDKIGIHISENTPPTMNKKNSTLIKPLTENKTPSTTLKITEKKITNFDNVKLRKDLFSRTSTITDEEKRRELRSRLTKINSIIKTNNYNTDEIHKQLNIIKKEIK